MACLLVLDCGQERTDLCWRPQVANPLRCGGVGHELSVLGSQAAVAKPEHAIALHRAAPQWTVVRPPRRICEQALDEALGHPPAVRDERQTDVDQRIGGREPLPGGRLAAETIDDPRVAADEIGVHLEVLVMRDCGTAGFERSEEHTSELQSL